MGNGSYLTENIGWLYKERYYLDKMRVCTEEFDHFEIIETGHTIPDDNSIAGIPKIIDMVKGLTEEDNIVFLL